MAALLPPVPADLGAPTVAGRATRMRVAIVLSWTALLVTVAASVAGLVLDGVYQGGGVAADASSRGGDLVNLVVAVPALAGALLVAVSGSRRGQLVLLGMLSYLVYTYAYHVFEPGFNDLFLAHVTIFTTAWVALVFAIAGIDVTAIARGFHPRTPARVIAVFALLVAAALAWRWGSASVRFAVSGAQPTDVLPFPQWRIHLGYALDLAVVLPAAVCVGIVLWRRTALGYVLAAAWALWLAVFQVNYAVQAVFVARAGIAGVAVPDPVSLVAVAVFAVPAAVLLAGVRGRTDESSGSSPHP